MHDIDRTQLEAEMDALESEPLEFTEEFDLSITPQMESPFDEAEEIALATELLTVSSEAELDQFLGKLFRSAWRGIRRVGSVVGRIARPLGGILKGVAKAALPVVGGALGSLIPIPGVGTAVGTALGSAVSKALEMELGELSQEDQEFEMCRRFVRLAGTAAQEAALAQPGVDPQAAARAAVMTAARQHVPGLAGTAAGPATPTATAAPTATAVAPDRSGRWIRRGRKIILFGV